MGTMAKPLLFLALWILAQPALTPGAVAGNVFDDFSRAPTFTPPDGCVPTEHAYGVVSRCEAKIEPGRTFVALIDTAMGTMGANPGDHETRVFVDDQVQDIKQYWKDYPGKNLAFSSKVSDIIPAGAPAYGTNCDEYSLTIETKKSIGGQPKPAVMRLDGLTCAWPVEDAEPGKLNIELFWVEGYEEYVPSIGQEPMESFDAIVHKLLTSARLLMPRPYLVPAYAAKNAMLSWSETNVNACFGTAASSDVIAGETRYFYARDDCKLHIMFQNGKVLSVEGYGSEQECWWLMNACERGQEYREAPRDRLQRWTLGELVLCFGVPTADPNSFNFRPLDTPSKDNPMQMGRDGCSMSVDLEKSQHLTIFDWSETEKGACRRVLQKCEEILPSKF